MKICPAVVCSTASKVAATLPTRKALDAHRSSKRFKKRLKKLKEKQYTQEEADAAGGLQKQKYIPYGDSKQKKKKNSTGWGR